LVELTETFKEYKTEFLKECLIYYNYDKEKTINAILEETIPLNLKLKGNMKTNEDIDVGINLNSPLTHDISPKIFENLNFFDTSTVSVHKGKKKIEIGEIDDELRDKYSIH
jgi:hypothetical protein